MAPLATCKRTWWTANYPEQSLSVVDLGPNSGVAVGSTGDPPVSSGHWPEREGRWHRKPTYGKVRGLSPFRAASRRSAGQRPVLGCKLPIRLRIQPRQLLFTPSLDRILAGKDITRPRQLHCRGIGIRMSRVDCHRRDLNSGFSPQTAHALSPAIPRYHTSSLFLK